MPLPLAKYDAVDFRWVFCGGAEHGTRGRARSNGFPRFLFPHSGESVHQCESQAMNCVIH
jgi:hypothetical protein